jgi:hypothetical protein
MVCTLALYLSKERCWIKFGFKVKNRWKVVGKIRVSINILSLATKHSVIQAPEIENSAKLNEAKVPVTVNLLSSLQNNFQSVTRFSVM